MLITAVFSVMTIDKNEPEDVPADDKNDEQSPKPKEITEKVTIQSKPRPCIVHTKLIMCLNTSNECFTSLLPQTLTR